MSVQGTALPFEFITASSIHLFHLGSFVSSTLNFLKWGQIIIIAEALIVIINAEAELDHAVNASSKLCGLIEVKSRGEKRCVEKKPNKILDCFVRFISCCFLLEFRHDGMFWIHLHGLLRHHVRGHG